MKLQKFTSRHRSYCTSFIWSSNASSDFLCPVFFIFNFIRTPSKHFFKSLTAPHIDLLHGLVMIYPNVVAFNSCSLRAHKSQVLESTGNSVATPPYQRVILAVIAGLQTGHAHSFCAGPCMARLLRGKACPFLASGPLVCLNNYLGKLDNKAAVCFISSTVGKSRHNFWFTGNRVAGPGDYLLSLRELSG